MSLICSEPFRLFFPLGIFSLLYGILIWVPQAWGSDSYPVILHRYLLLNGFTASFIAGFLMTAVPRFSKTQKAKSFEIGLFLSVTLIGAILAHLENIQLLLFVSGTQALLILSFLLSRIFKRQENPPYSFIFIFVGLLLWILSSLGGIISDQYVFDRLHYEGAIASIILGVGSRLIPGIFGHVDIVGAQRAVYEKPVPLIKTVPLHFFGLILIFVASYFLSFPLGELVRALVVTVIGMGYWRLQRLPKIKSALTTCLWISGWLIVLSFIARSFNEESGIHLSHSFFVNGIVMLSLLIATRVIQSHGPNDKRLEDWQGLYVVTACLLVASITRASAYFLPESYLSHLGYSASLLVLGVSIWGIKYLPYVYVRKSYES